VRSVNLPFGAGYEIAIAAAALAPLPSMAGSGALLTVRVRRIAGIVSRACEELVHLPIRSQGTRAVVRPAGTVRGARGDHACDRSGRSASDRIGGRDRALRYTAATARKGSIRMTTGYTLYGRAGSGSLAVQVALEEIGAPYECVWIPNEPEPVATYRKLNPTGRVPALGLPDGTVMFESAAILIHLAAAHPGARLAPQPGSSGHARFLQWMVYLSANVYEAVLRVYYSERFSTRGAADAEAIRDQGTADYLANLSLIDAVLAPYVLGADYSIADSYLSMLAGWHPGDKAQLYARMPRLEALVSRVSARPSVVKAEADHGQ
jgi:glutathione S-transferase